MGMKTFIQKLPKTELHVHLEGTLEGELMLKLAQKNGVTLPYKNLQEIKEAYNFKDLQSFLDLYYNGANVLQTKEDFYTLTKEYLDKCVEENICHVEAFFDPQTHTQRGVKFEDVLFGIKEAFEEAKQIHGITYFLIPCFLRHLSEDDAFKTYEDIKRYKSHIKGVGLDSSEVGNPPSKFERVFKKAKDDGFKLVAHAGEEADVSYMYEAISLLHVDRIDHGVQVLTDKKLMQILKTSQMPLTVCPNSNIELKVFEDYKLHPIKSMLDFGLNVCVNSDDPAYFKGYLVQNFLNIQKALNLDKKDIKQLAINSFVSSFLDEKTKAKHIENIKQMS